MIQLDAVCDVQAGYSFRGKVPEDPQGVFALVQMRDVDYEALTIGWDDLTRVDDIEPRPHHFVRPGDVLFTAKGHYNRAILVETIVSDTLAASTFLVLRPSRPDVSPAFVAWYLNSPAAQAHLQMCARGTNILSINKQCLGGLMLPLPPVETQRRIVEIDRLARKEAALLHALADKRRQYTEAACFHLIHDLFHEPTDPERDQ